MRRQRKVFPESSDFFKKNEREQNRLALRLSYFVPLSGIGMLIGALVGVFKHTSIAYCLILTGALALISVFLKIACSINPENPAIKYVLVVSAEAVVFVLTITKGFSPFIIYALAPLLSCIYFNRNFCLFSSTMSYVAMLISIIIRAQPENPMNEGMDSLTWGLEYGVGLSLEYFLNIGLLYLMSLKHLDVLNENLSAIKTFQRTQEELIAGYSELVFQAHQTRKMNVKRCQACVARLCDILKDHNEYPGLKNEDIVNAVISSVPLHDIGLIGVSDAIVSKTTAFTEEEKKEYQKHVLYGEELIRKNFYLSENREFLMIARMATLHHHERWDGTGYPEKLVGTAIPVCARIMAVADELEARISGDNEHTAVSFEVALSQIQKLSGTVLDPVIVEALMSSRLSIEELYTGSH